MLKNLINISWFFLFQRKIRFTSTFNNTITAILSNNGLRYKKALGKYPLFCAHFRKVIKASPVYSNRPITYLSCKSLHFVLKYIKFTISNQQKSKLLSSVKHCIHSAVISVLNVTLVVVLSIKRQTPRQK